MKILRSVLLAALLLAPALVFGQTQTARFNVSWNASAVLPDGSNTPSGYKLERATGAAGTFAQIVQTPAITLTFAGSIANDPGGIVYCYRVRATNTVGDSPYSSTACGTSPIILKAPSTPQGLTVSALSPTQIKLSWKDTSDNELGFQSQRNGQIVAEYAMNQTSAIDTGLIPRTWYIYRVRALGDGGTSAWSNSAKVKTPR